MTDLAALAAVAGLLGAAVGAGEALRAWTGWAPDATRRAVHALVGLTVAASLPWFSGPTLVYLLAGAFVVANAVARARGWFPGMHGAARQSVGTVVFPLALILALALTWSLSADRVWAAQAAFVVLALADPAASRVGARARRGRFAVGRATKSAAGSAAFFVVASASTAAMLAMSPPEGWGPGALAGAVFSVASVATAAEAVGRSGWDNLLIVLAVVVVLVGVPPEAAGRSALAVGVAVVFGAVAWRARALDVSGALAGGLLAWALVALGGVAWAAPALAFFVLSSAWSRLPPVAAPGEAGARTSGQVLANGGVSLAALALWAVRPAEASLAWHVLPWAAFAGGFAAAAADTWATEIGTRWGGVPRRLVGGQAVAPGASGGVTGAGTLAAAGGAASVGVAAAWGAGLPWTVAAGIAGAGLAGAAVDSWLGATWQARHRAPDGRLVEDAPDGAPLVSGLGWLTNGAVNVACTAAGALAALIGAALALG